MMKTSERWICALLLCLGWTLAGWAQELPGSNPQAPSGPVMPDDSTSKPDQVEDTNAVTPDVRPLAGAQEIGVGMHKRPALKYLAPSFSIMESYDTNYRNFTGQQVGRAVTVASGELELRRQVSRRQFTMRYQGGATFDRGESGASSSFHRLGLEQAVNFRRVSLLLGDEFSYLPESQLGYGQYVPDVNQSLLDLRSGITPSQSILTEHNTRASNTALGQVQFQLDRSDSITANASYGMLRFLDQGGLQDSDQLVSGIGFEHALNRNDNIAINYGATRFTYNRLPVSVLVQSVQGTYGRRLLGKLAVRVSAGPQFVDLQDVPGAGKNNPASFTGSASLRYSMRQGEAGLSYTRGITGGSGVLTGAESDTVRASYSRRLSRLLGMALDFGYAHSSSLSGASLGPQMSFDTVTGRVQITRSLTRTADLYFSYDAQNQDVQTLGCSGVACGLGLRHVFGIGLTWRPRPIRIE